MKEALRAQRPVMYLSESGMDAFAVFPEVAAGDALPILAEVVAREGPQFPGMTPRDWAAVYLVTYWKGDAQEAALQEANAYLEDLSLPEIEADKARDFLDDMQEQFTEKMAALTKELSDIVQVQEFLQANEPIDTTPIRAVFERYDFRVEFEDGDLVRAWQSVTPSAQSPWILSNHAGGELLMRTVETTDRNRHFWANFPAEPSTALAEESWMFSLWMEAEEDPEAAAGTITRVLRGLRAEPAARHTAPEHAAQGHR